MQTEAADQKRRRLVLIQRLKMRCSRKEQSDNEGESVSPDTKVKTCGASGARGNESQLMQAEKEQQLRLILSQNPGHSLRVRRKRRRRCTEILRYALLVDRSIRHLPHLIKRNDTAASDSAEQGHRQ